MLARAAHRDVGNGHAGLASDVLPYCGRIPRNVGKWDYAALLRILFVNSCHRQRAYSEKVRPVRSKSEKQARAETGRAASQKWKQRWAELERLDDFRGAFFYRLNLFKCRGDRRLRPSQWHPDRVPHRAARA